MERTEVEATAARLVEEQLGRSVTEAAQVIGRGTVNSVVVVVTPEGRVVVRIAEVGRDEFGKERWAMAAARRVGVLCPEVLADGWLEGEHRRGFSLQTYVGDRDAQPSDNVWLELGGLLGRLHRIEVRGWGLDMDESEAFDRRFESHVDFNVGALGKGDPLRERGLLNAQESASLRSVFEEIAARDWPMGLCHCDVALRNLRVCDDGRVALLDWGCARADVVPAKELADVIREHDPAGSQLELLLRGYGVAWSDVRDDVHAISLLSCTDLSRWCLDNCPEKIGYYGALLRWALDLHLHRKPWCPAPRTSAAP